MNQNTANQDIRTEATQAGVKLWQIAYKYPLTDSNFTRKLRKELSDAEKEKIRALIKELANEEE